MIWDNLEQFRKVLNNLKRLKAVWNDYDHVLLFKTIWNYFYYFDYIVLF